MPLDIGELLQAHPGEVARGHDMEALKGRHLHLPAVLALASNQKYRHHHCLM